MSFLDGGDAIILNDAGEFSAKFAQRVGKGRSKPRRTIEIRSEPLLHDFDPFTLGARPAQAIRDVLSRAVKAVTAVASVATLQRRERAKRRMSGSPSPKQQDYRRRGAEYAGSYEDRYSGGRTGVTMPGQTVRLFNDSVRLADGFFVRQNPKDSSYTVNVTANRLDPSEFKPGLFDRMLEQLRQHVPLLADARRLMEDPEVRAAINEGIRDFITKGDSRHRGKLEAAARARKQAIMALIRGFQSLASP